MNTLAKKGFSVRRLCRNAWDTSFFPSIVIFWRGGGAMISRWFGMSVNDKWTRFETVGLSRLRLV